MRVLFLSDFLPYPKESGGKTRLYHLLKELSESNLDPCFLLLNAGTADRQNLKNSQEFFSKINFRSSSTRISSWRKLLHLLSNLIFSNDIFLPVGWKSELHKIVAEEKIDWLQFEFMQSAWFLPQGYAKTILVVHEIVSRKIRQQLKNTALLKKIMLFARYRFYYLAESVLFPRFKMLITMSEADKEHILARHDGLRITVVPNGVDTAEIVFCPFRPELKIKLFYLGWYGNEQNNDALNYFFDQIQPLLSAEAKKIGGLIIGRDLPEVLASKAGVVGWEYHPYLAEPELQKEVENGILIVPLRQGSGTRLKILEAFARGNPVVSTSVGAEGISACDNEELLVADHPEKFAQAVESLIKERGRWQQLTENARQLAENRYDWQVCADKQTRCYLDDDQQV